MDYFNFIASIVTVLSAIWTFYSALAVKRDLKTISKIKLEIIEKRNFKELTELYHLTKKIQNTFNKFGFAVTDNSLKGINLETESLEMQNYLNKLIENIHFFDETKQNFIKEIHKEIGQNTTKLTSTNQSNIVKKNGIKIIDNLSQILTILNKMIYKLEYKTNE